MTRLLLTMVSLLAVATAANAQNPAAQIPAPPVKSTPTLSVDRAKLREHLWIPQTSLLLQFGKIHAPLEKIPSKGKKLSPAEEIAALKKQLTGTPRDAEIYLKMSEATDDEAASDFYCGFAADLFPNRVAEDPKNGVLWAMYSQALLGAKKVAESEKSALRATELSPRDWRTWRSLANIRTVQMNLLLCGPNKKWSGGPNYYNEFIAFVLSRKLSQAVLDKGEGYLREVGKYRDNEVGVAPDEPDVYTDHIDFGFLSMALRGGLPAPFSREKLATAKLPPSILADTRELARLCPDNIYVQSSLVGIAFVDGMSQIADTLKPDNHRPASGSPVSELRAAFAKIPELNQKVIRDATATLKRLAAQEDFPESMSRDLALYICIQGDLATALHHAERAMRMNPKRDESHDLLELITIDKIQQDFAGKNLDDKKIESQMREAAKAVVRISQARLTQIPSSRNALHSAKLLCGKLADFNEAEKVLRSAHEREPNDIRCTIGLAVTLMLKGDRAADLAEALTCLRPAWNHEGVRGDPQIWCNWEVAYDVCLALNGQVRESHERILELSRRYPDTEQIKALLGAFSR